ncbi:DUF1992 domain-containing protein [Marinococcus halophilus]|uniref:DnaJ homologue subfamily C member 28 conserved domain-containing protein n=1 Tax=Marinococcus halophilus TaxID=1371 RepID=A0A510Y6H8_MARHA|nr:DUF1992 domain-containing protein [Marinococcus halophilus]OZT80608.1 DUF1992 domain-containing protein [Marinococcus halophilus]GEK58966.1 hypothetical protein MHA01_18710 [Marinococcus halophilus]
MALSKEYNEKLADEKEGLTYRDPIGELIREHEKKGGFDNLQGRGEPLSKEYLQNDTFDTLLKRNGFVPSWVRLQREIREELEKVLNQQLYKKASEHRIKKEISKINKKIRRYNQLCPTPGLQRCLIEIDSIQGQYENWR